MNNRLFFKYTSMLTGIMVLSASTCALASDEQKDAHQVQTTSNWSKMQSVAPKLFGAGLVVGGACGAYVYSGALKKYVTEQPLDALKNTVCVLAGLGTNVWLRSRVSKLTQERITKDPGLRADFSCLFLPGLTTIATNLLILYHLPFSIYALIGGSTLVNLRKAQQCVTKNEGYDRADITAIAGIKGGALFVSNAMNFYDNMVQNSKTVADESILLCRNNVSQAIASNKQQIEFFQKYLAQRDAASASWVNEVCRESRRLHSIYDAFDAQWNPEESKSSGKYPLYLASSYE